MRKKITFLFIGALVALSMILPCSADDSSTDLLTDITTEIVTEAVDGATEETPVEDTTTEKPVEGSNTPVEGAVEEDTDSEWETFKEKITDSATWTMIGASIVTILTIAGTVKSKFDKISSLVHSKADNETIAKELKDTKEELKKAYEENHKKVADVMKRYEDALKNTEATEQKMYAILTLFMTNCKISESAKAEILKLLADVKKYEGSPSEIIEQAQEAIDKEIAEKEGAMPPTPNLDKLLDEDYMELG